MYCAHEEPRVREGRQDSGARASRRLTLPHQDWLRARRAARAGGAGARVRQFLWRNRLFGHVLTTGFSLPPVLLGLFCKGALNNRSLLQRRMRFFPQNAMTDRPLLPRHVLTTEYSLFVDTSAHPRSSNMHKLHTQLHVCIYIYVTYIYMHTQDLQISALSVHTYVYI